MFTISSQYAWTMRIDEKDVVNYQQISNIFANRTSTPIARSPRGMIQVSRWTFTTALPDGAVGSTDRTIQSRLYGVPLSGGWFYVGVENSFDTNNWVAAALVVGPPARHCSDPRDRPASCSR